MIIDSILHRIIHKKGDQPGKENWKRSLAKSISWRILGSVDTILIAFFLTGAFEVALSIGGVEFITKMMLYFFHERLWNQIKWGK